MKRQHKHRRLSQMNISAALHQDLKKKKIYCPLKQRRLQLPRCHASARLHKKRPESSFKCVYFLINEREPRGVFPPWRSRPVQAGGFDEDHMLQIKKTTYICFPNGLNCKQQNQFHIDLIQHFHNHRRRIHILVKLFFVVTFDPDSILSQSESPRPDSWRF